MDIIYQKTTQHTYEDAIRRITEELKARRFGVLWQFDMTGKLNEHDLDLGAKVTILEVCNPVQAHKVLTTALDVAYFLPCKVAVFEQAGMVRIGTVKPSVLMGLMDGVDLSAVAQEVEQVLKDSVDAAVV